MLDRTGALARTVRRGGGSDGAIVGMRLSAAWREAGRATHGGCQPHPAGERAPVAGARLAPPGSLAYGTPTGG